MNAYLEAVWSVFTVFMCLWLYLPEYLGFILHDLFLSSDLFTILGLWVLGLVVSHINESRCKLMSPEHYF